MLCLVLLVSSSAGANPKQDWVKKRVVAGLSLVSFVLYYSLVADSQGSSYLRSGSRGLDTNPTSTQNLPDLDLAYSQILGGLFPDGIFNEGGDQPVSIGSVHEDIARRKLKATGATSMVSLPQFDPTPKDRSDALLAIQGEIQNYPRSFAYDGIHAESISRGPLPLPGSLAQKMVVKEIVDLLSRATVNSSLIIPQEIFGLPITTLGDIGSLYSHMTGYPIPKGLTNWTDDHYFADLRRTYLGHNLKRLPMGKPLFKTGLKKEQVKELLGEVRTFENSELYASDFSEVGNYTAQDGRAQYAPSAQMMYGMDRKNHFVVLAIKLGNGFVYTRFDSEGEWILAKIAANTAEFLWTSATHFSKTHLLVEPIRTEMMRHLSVNHPLYILLSHHMKNLYGNTVAGLVSLFSKGTTLDLVSGWGAQGYMKFLGKHPEDFTDFSRTLEADTEARGLERLKNNRQLSDKKALLATVRKFVHSYLGLFYGDCGERDRNVREDFELQSWASAVHSPDGAGVSHFPPQFNSFESLEDAVVQVIYLLGIEHHAMNSNALWHGYPLPASSMALWSPLPKKKGGIVNPRAFIAPNQQVVIAQILLIEFFLRKLNVADSLAGSYDTLSLGNLGHLGNVRIEEMIRHYQEDMQKLQGSIQLREKNGKGRAIYDILAPNDVPDFVWVR